MKKIISLIMVAAVALGIAAPSAKAQYYEIANQIPQLITPALTGGMRYKGFAEAKYIKGIGNHNVDFLGFSTSQGFKYADWFFMGVGIGVDVVFSHVGDNPVQWNPNVPAYDSGRSTTNTGVMIPLFTDFRFNIGGQSSASFFFDVKLGCSFLVGKDYLRVDNGYLSSEEYFYLRPSLGVRIPVNKNNSRQAVNVGVSYQLLTSNYWNSYYSNVTLNGLGVDLSYEW